MKQTILKYISLLAFLGSPFFSSQTFAAECATGTAPLAGCTIDVSDITYTLTGNITPASGDIGIQFNTGADRNTVTLTGNITTTGDDADGLVLLTSDSNTTTLTGNITTTGRRADGLYLYDSDSNTTTLTGNITTTGDDARGLWLFDSNSNTTTITGNISTAGAGAHGVVLSTSDSNTTLTGNITTTGYSAYGLILYDSDSNTTRLTGNISTTGDDAYGLWLYDSDSNSINLTGSLSATGASSYAIYADSTSDNNTITFNQGSKIIGGLYNDGTNNTLTFNLGRAASYNFTTSGAVNWVLEDTSKPIVEGSAKSMGVSDIDNQAHILYRRMDPVNDVLSERQRLYTEGQRPTGYYMDSYYGHDKRDEDYSEISGNAGGVTVGYVLENTATPMEVLVNFEVSQDNYGSGLAKQITETNSLLAGLFLPAIAEDVMGGNLSAKVLVGMSDNDAKRTVLNNSLGTSTASEKVSGDYNSGFISAGAEWLTEFLKVERVSHELSVGADLVQAYNEDYTAGEYKVDSRDMTQIQSRVLYGMTYKNLAKTVDVNTRFGVSNQYMVAGDKQDYQINGTSVSYTGDDNSFYYTAGLGAKYYLADNTNLYVDTKYGQSSDDIQNLTVDFGFISRF